MLPKSRLISTRTPGQVLARGSMWIAAGQGLAAIASAAGSVVAARVLSPSDFGLMGLATMAIGTLNSLSQTGFDRALIQRRDVEGFIEVAWTAQVIRGVVLSLLVLGIAWPLAAFYHEPALMPILALMSLSALSQGFRSVANILFNRSLEFRALFTVDATRALANLTVMLTLVLTLRNVWALVIAHVASAVVELIISYVMRPRRPRFSWDAQKVAELMRFGKWISGMAVLGLIVTRGDDMFISRYLGTTAFGFYVFAYEISNLPATNITHVLGRVSFPTYARLHEAGNEEALRQTFYNVMKATLLICGPLSALIWLDIGGFVEHVIGSKWTSIVPLVQILALAGFVRAVAALAAGLFHAVGRPDLDFKMNLPRFAILVGLIWPACHFLGLSGAAWVVFLSVVACLPTWIRGMRILLGVTLLQILRENLLTMIATAAFTGALLGARALLPASSLAAFIGQLLLALALWMGFMWLVEKRTKFRLFSEMRRLSQAIKKPRAM